MSKSAFTLKAFGYYMLALGVGLILAPNTVLAVFQMPTTNEVWIRVGGILSRRVSSTVGRFAL